MLSILGSDWLIKARTPYPRLRGSNNYVIPDNKLPQEEEEKKDNEKVEVKAEEVVEVVEVEEVEVEEVEEEKM